MKEDPNIVDAEIVDEPSPQNSEKKVEETADLKSKLLSAEHWLRCVFMVLFVAIACVASYVVFVLVVIQFLFALITGNPEERLRAFGGGLSQYIFQILGFLTYNSEQKPFPFADWPAEDAS
jgi:hypothetical protein